jgi:putative hydrolase of the HAD superfamily
VTVSEGKIGKALIPEGWKTVFRSTKTVMIGLGTINQFQRNIQVQHRFVVKKRVKIKQQCFENISEEIVAMLDILKKKKIKIGLISNCFSEEVEVIKDSILYNYFDVCCLSYEMGIKKPDQRIFRECVKMLDVKENECIYIGDGGSNELDAAKSVGIRAVQATWFISEQSKQYKIKPDVEHLNRPINIEKLISALDVKNRQN